MRPTHSRSSAPLAAENSREADIAALHRICGVYTKPKIVSHILDAIGWKSEANLSQARLLEPAAGNGQFIVEAARRLVASCQKHGVKISTANLLDRITAFELYPRAVEEAQSRTKSMLRELGVHHRTADSCSSAWIANADFLLSSPSGGGFTHAVGNPPYVRWAKIPDTLKETYSERLSPTMTGGDLFLPFLDHSLEQLHPKGRCGFICSDRWRFMAFADAFRRKWLPLLDITTTQTLTAQEAFLSDVDSYPSLLIAQKRPKQAQVNRQQPNKPGKTLRELGYIVKVGPALGHTPAFVLGPDEHTVEPHLLRPWLDSTEISEGTVSWRGRRVITIFDDTGQLVDLDHYPMLAQHLEAFRSKLSERYIVRQGGAWYRTIDRVRAVDWRRPKLLIPELAKIPRLALDRSGAIPSHGIYAIFAAEDDLMYLYEKLREGKLAHALADISPKVKGGYFRCYKRFLMDIRIANELLIKHIP